MVAHIAAAVNPHCVHIVHISIVTKGPPLCELRAQTEGLTLNWEPMCMISLCRCYGISALTETYSAYLPHGRRTVIERIKWSLPL